MSKQALFTNNLTGTDSEALEQLISYSISNNKKGHGYYFTFNDP